MLGAGLLNRCPTLNNIGASANGAGIVSLGAMQYELLLDHIGKHIQLAPEQQALFLSFLHHKKLRRKQFLLQEGAISLGTSFVLKGLLRLYSIDRNGFEHILQFAPPGWWIGDLQSFLKQQPATLNIDALEDSEIAWIQKKDLTVLYEKIPAFERLFRILAENSLGMYQHRLINFLSLPALDRYNNFCSLYPTLIGTLPQKQIAGYIGVTPEFLSKMLRNNNGNQ